ncbi:MAG: hypothetical protein LBN29_02090 [Mediterranea sp.]|nr:hypothetical protein [Mediterranea sp.]
MALVPVLAVRILAVNNLITELSQVFEFRIDKPMNRRPERFERLVISDERLVMNEALDERPERAFSHISALSGHPALRLVNLAKSISFLDVHKYLYSFTIRIAKALLLSFKISALCSIRQSLITKH